MFRISPSDISSNCEDPSLAEIDGCPSGTKGDYALYCDDQDQACQVLLDMSDLESWFGPDPTNFKRWMSYFPKCIKKENVDVLQLIPGKTFSVEDPMAPEKCSAGATPEIAYSLIIKNASTGRLECKYAINDNVLVFPDNEASIESSESCEPCFRSNYDGHNLEFLTCGSTDSFSVYCEEPECKVQNTQQKFFHHFGCFNFDNVPLDTAGEYFEGLPSLEHCFHSCIQDDTSLTDLIFSVLNERGLIDCYCYVYDEDYNYLNLTMEDMTQGCESHWSPPVPFPVGTKSLNSLHCQTDACSKVVRYDKWNFVTPLYDCACGECEPITTTTTTEGTTTTEDPFCPRYCKSKVDDRNFTWSDTCAGDYISSDSYCPILTNGNHILDQPFLHHILLSMQLHLQYRLIHFLTGNATWYCDPDTLEFYPDQPDRTDCIPVWIDEVEMIADKEGGNPNNITAEILEHIDSFEEREMQVRNAKSKLSKRPGF